ncbi:hypothetical protein MAR_035365, partial [Mya arenaria]
MFGVGDVAFGTSNAHIYTRVSLACAHRQAAVVVWMDGKVRRVLQPMFCYLYYAVRRVLQPMLCYLYYAVRRVLQPMLYYLYYAVRRVLQPMFCYLYYAVRLRRVLQPMLCYLYYAVRRVLQPMLCYLYYAVRRVLQPMLCYLYYAVRRVLQPMLCYLYYAVRRCAVCYIQCYVTFITQCAVCYNQCYVTFITQCAVCYNQCYVTFITQCAVCFNQCYVTFITQCAVCFNQCYVTFITHVPCATSNAPIWSNQDNFNYVNFKLSAIFEPMSTIYQSETYVSTSGFGIVSGNAHIVHRKVNKDQSGKPFIAYNHTFSCSDVSNTNPSSGFNCTLSQKDYIYSIEHGDNFTVTFNVKSGGFRNLRNINTNRFYNTNVYDGHTVSDTVEFKFDFVAPKHCSEPDSGRTCRSGEEPIRLNDDLTKNPITPRWSGWFDTLSGLLEYRLEAYLLEPNIHDELIELNPLSPVFTYTENNTNNVEFPTFTPPRSGMFSVLLTAVDMASNTKIARRLVLFDDSSEITITKPGLLTKMPNPEDVEQIVVGDGGLYIVSAIKETGYLWQTSSNDSKSQIEINWANHFKNKVHDEGKLLNKVLPYPTQFQDLEDDGILRSKKYVAIDDNEGDRTLKAIPSKHGLVKFELSRVYTDDKEIPTKWEPIPLEESYVIFEKLNDGSHVRVWLRATDVMNNTAVDYTEVHIDNTPPRFLDEHLEMNIKNGTYTYASRVTFQASDDGSGVHKLQMTFYVGNSSIPKKVYNVSANKNDTAGICEKDPSCNCVLDVCYRAQQMIEFDNCWFLVPKEDLNKSATLQVTTYNQALLSRKFNL